MQRQDGSPNKQKALKKFKKSMRKRLMNCIAFIIKKYPDAALQKKEGNFKSETLAVTAFYFERMLTKIGEATSAKYAVIPMEMSAEFGYELRPFFHAFYLGIKEFRATGQTDIKKHLLMHNKLFAKIQTQLFLLKNHVCFQENKMKIQQLIDSYDLGLRQVELAEIQTFKALASQLKTHETDFMGPEANKYIAPLMQSYAKTLNGLFVSYLKIAQNIKPSAPDCEISFVFDTLVLYHATLREIQQALVDLPLVYGNEELQDQFKQFFIILSEVMYDLGSQIGKPTDKTVIVDPDVVRKRTEFIVNLSAELIRTETSTVDAGPRLPEAVRQQILAKLSFGKLFTLVVGASAKLQDCLSAFEPLLPTIEACFEKSESCLPISIYNKVALEQRAPLLAYYWKAKSLKENQSMTMESAFQKAERWLDITDLNAAKDFLKFFNRSVLFFNRLIAEEFKNYSALLANLNLPNLTIKTLYEEQKAIFVNNAFQLKLIQHVNRTLLTFTSFEGMVKEQEPTATRLQRLKFIKYYCEHFKAILEDIQGALAELPYVLSETDIFLKDRQAFFEEKLSAFAEELKSIQIGLKIREKSIGSSLSKNNHLELNKEPSEVMSNAVPESTLNSAEEKCINTISVNIVPQENETVLSIPEAAPENDFSFRVQRRPRNKRSRSNVYQGQREKQRIDEITYSNKMLFDQIWQQLRMGNLQAANKLLMGVPSDARRYQWQFAKAQYYVRIRAFEKAINLYTEITQTCKFSEKRYQAFLSIAFCHKKNKDPEAAIAAIKNVSNWKKNTYAIQLYVESLFIQHKESDALILLERLPLKNNVVILSLLITTHQRLGNNDKALDIIQKLTALDDYAGLFALGGFYKLNYALEDAVKTYQRIPAWRNDKKIFGEVMDALIKQNKFSEAMAELQACDYPNDQQRRLLATCYYEMGQAGQAIEFLMQTPYWQKDQQILSLLIQCYQFLHDSEKVLALCQSPALKGKRLGHLLLGKHYLSVGNVEEAKATFQQIDNYAADSEVKVQMAICLEKSRQFEEAEQLLKPVENSHKPSQLLQLAILYKKKRAYTKVIECLGAVKDVESHPKFLLLLAQAHEARGQCNDMVMALNYFQLLSTNFPFYAAGMVARIKFLLAHQGESAEQLIKTALSQWPSLPKLYAFSAVFYRDFGKHEPDVNQRMAIAILEKALVQFPHAAELYFELLNCYQQSLQWDKLNNTLDECKMRFANDTKLLDEMERRFQQPVKFHSSSTEAVPKVIELPEHILEALEYAGGYKREERHAAESLDLNCSYQQHMGAEFVEPALISEGFKKLPSRVGTYLGGGAARTLYLGGHMDLVKDLDFISTAPFQAFNHQFSLSPHAKERVHLTARFNLAGRCMPMDVNLIQNSDLLAKALSSDFTNSALFYANGVFYDPLGRAARDVKAGRLCAVGDPVKLFKKNPVCLLRAVKFIVEAQIPDEALEQALQTFQGDISDHQEHLWAVLRRCLSTLVEKVKFVQTLARYDLLNKLFQSTAPCDTPEQAFVLIRQLQAKAHAILAPSSVARSRNSLFHVDSISAQGEAPISTMGATL